MQQFAIIIIALTVTLAATSVAQPVVVDSPLPPGLKQGQGAGHPKGRYAELDKLPDFGGIWFRVFSPKPGPPDKPKLKGKYKQKYEEYVAEVKANQGVLKSERSHCSPPGMPFIMQMFQYPYEFLFTPGRVTVNQEAWMQTRTIWTDGRSHRTDPDPTYMGDSIGRWEANTLVVETIAIDDSLRLTPGTTHSDKLRVTERIHLDEKNPDILVNDITLSDPEALEEPFHVSIQYRRDRNGRLIEFQCSENDRNTVDAQGNTTSH